MIKNYGLQLAPPELSAYRLGAIELPKKVLREDGQWDKFLPKDELQHTPSFDTYGCTVYGTENVKQILEKFHYGETKEYDERYNYNLAKIVPPGADPHMVADIFRNNGVVNGVFPMTETLEEYSKPRPMPQKYVTQGVAHPYELRHQWVWEYPLSDLRRKELIQEYLKYSPLCVSVTAWKQSGDVYVDGGQSNTHWTVLYGYTDRGYKVYDSYAPHKKLLSFEHNIQVCKRYQLVPSTRQAQISIIEKLLELLKKLLGIVESQTPVPTPPKPELPPLQALKWSTPQEARHSVRVLCDDLGLSVADKNTICAVISCESGFNTKAVNKNSDARQSTDYGICQYNSFWYIGEGKPIASIDEALNNPEKCVRVMINQFKKGQLRDWVCYSSGKWVNYL